MSPALNRRGFLKGAAATGLGAAAQTLGPAAWQRSALAQNVACNTTGTGLWGDLVGTIGSGATAWTCGNFPGHKILEIYLYGGASQWETFWLADSNMLPDFNNQKLDLDLLPFDDMAWTGYTNFSNCTVQSDDPDIPKPTTNPVWPSSKDWKYFANDKDGNRVYWGAAAKPLWAHPTNILARCRMVTHGHGLTPHEAAIPYCLTGLPLGNDRMAATGAAVERRARMLDPTRVLPASYVLHTGAPLAESAVAAIGQHPGFSRPLVIKVQSNNDFVFNLQRTGITSASDDLFLALRHEYRDRMRFQGIGDLVRSAGFDGYWAAAELLKSASSLQNLFLPNLLVIDSANQKICPTFPSTFLPPSHPSAFVPQQIPAAIAPGTKTMLNAAAQLLAGSSTAVSARYVCVIDGGLTGNYDTHGNNTDMHLQSTCANLYDVLKHLSNLINATLVNLNDTMVVITTEFGRTSKMRAKGRDHHPFGYASILIGGPIPAAGGARIVGAIDANGNTPDAHKYAMADVRGAMLLAAGIDPFDAGNFEPGDFSAALHGYNLSKPYIREQLREKIILGN
jgi:hypothetical protein